MLLPPGTESGHAAACRVYGLPIISLTIDGRPHLDRGGFRRESNAAAEALAVVCLSGPAAEELCCGPIIDGSDLVDERQARNYLHAVYPDGQIEFQLRRMRTAAERLVASERARIEVVADALLQRGSLTGAAVIELLNDATASWLR